ncbi:hypothetical protein AC1031_015525 [Aphanomyces cochlioides]|nr:hypothetical protein AC1031_015525 [Aphanomyces cochlioides]
MANGLVVTSTKRNPFYNALIIEKIMIASISKQDLASQSSHHSCVFFHWSQHKVRHSLALLAPRGGDGANSLFWLQKAVLLPLLHFRRPTCDVGHNPHRAPFSTKNLQ